MARGWESKSVESQQSDIDLDRKQRLSDAEIERRKKRESLELSRTRLSRELETARSDVHRTALQNGLSFLEGELKKLR